MVKRYVCGCEGGVRSATRSILVTRCAALKNWLIRGISWRSSGGGSTEKLCLFRTWSRGQGEVLQIKSVADSQQRRNEQAT
eukprot:1156489-Rhodomonas_salina.3